MRKFQGIGVNVFCSYAREDELLREKMEKHLKLLKRQGYIHIWHDRLISAGTDWAQAIDTQLNTASLILLLISADFMSSDYCYNIEMQRAMERHRNGEARVVPIVLRPTDWQGSPFAELQALPTDGKPITTWENEDAAFLNVAEGLRFIIEDKSLVQPIAYNSQSSMPSQDANWRLPPHSRNPLFTNREKELKDLYRYLHNSTEMIAFCALVGIGGIGKTQAAIEYAYRYQDHYSYCFWFPSNTRETLLASFIDLADQLNLPEKKAMDQRVTIRGVRRWLREHERWLLVFDNADDLAIISDFLPQNAKGHVLLTTQAQALGELMTDYVEVEYMPPKEGSLFLLRRAKILSRHKTLSRAAHSVQVAAEAFCNLVDGLPLALDQAGAYIDEVKCSVEEYLSLYHAKKADLLKRRGGIVKDHPESVATTFALSIQKVEQANSASVHLLRFLSFLQPDTISEEILKHGATELGPELQSIIPGTIPYNDALKELLRFSLVKRNSTTKMLSVHRLTQLIVKDQLSGVEQHEWARRTVFALNRAFPNPRLYANWKLCQLCIPQAGTCVELMKQWQLASAESIQLLNRFGYYVMRRGRYDEAEHFYQEALELGRQYISQEHPVFAETIFRSGELLYMRGNYAEAERLYKQALEVRERTLGPDHPDVALNLHNMALLYAEDELGKTPAEREALYQRSLDIWKQTLDSRDPDILEALNNLGSFYRRQRRFDEAETQLLQVLSIRKEVLGIEDPDTLLSMEAFAEVYLAQGKDDLAETLLRDGLAICERVLGKDHQYVARFLSNFRQLAIHRQNYSEAEQYVRRAMAIDERSFGQNHPYMVEHYSDLAEIYILEQRYTEAEQAYQRAITIQEEIQGPDHLDVAELLEKMALLFRATQRDADAAVYERRAAEIRSRASQ